jgi:hypothetical protein
MVGVPRCGAFGRPGGPTLSYLVATTLFKIADAALARHKSELDAARARNDQQEQLHIKHRSAPSSELSKK